MELIPPSLRAEHPETNQFDQVETGWSEGSSSKDSSEQVEFDVPSPKDLAQHKPLGLVGRSAQTFYKVNPQDTDAMIVGVRPRDEPDRTHDTSSSHRTAKGTDQRYVIWSILGSLLLSMASFIRGVEAGHPLPAKFTLSLAFLVLSILLITFY